MVLSSGRLGYTCEGTRDVEAAIDNLLQQVVAVVVRAVSPRSVVLHGSLGRGEGSAFLVNGKLQLASDLEIGCVTAKWWKKARLRTLQRSLENTLDVEIALSLFLPGRFSADRTSNWVVLPNPLTLEHYELISGLRVLWGSDPRPHLAIPSSAAINPWDAPRLLFNRVAELVGVLVSEHVETLKAKKSIAKLLIACGDAVLLLSHQYHFSYVERRRRLTALVGNSDGLPENVAWGDVSRAYDWKVAPARHESAKMSFPVAIRSLQSVMRWSLGIVLGVDLLHVDNVAEIYLGSPRLAECCRVFPGRPLLQNAVIVGKQITEGHLSVTTLAPWREVHRTYAQLLNLVARMAGEEHLNSFVAASLSRRDGLVATRLIRKWKSFCCMV